MTVPVLSEVDVPCVELEPALVVSLMLMFPPIIGRLSLYVTLTVPDIEDKVPPLYDTDAVTESPDVLLNVSHELFDDHEYVYAGRSNGIVPPSCVNDIVLLVGVVCENDVVYFVVIVPVRDDAVDEESSMFST